ncbi:unnamed protein product, partial [Mesorhabditis belari]|uniref:Amino acid permease/ SLC12A domain-containing protein n=1 Tax=Mesorhabditis belari TaxID=2138241 RepID=A0AAF3F0Q5_9BILA
MAGTSRSAPIDPPDSLYTQETGGETRIPWWQRNLLLNQPVLFGTWDGVFPTVMVNIFGIIVFLRMGWIVGTAGVANALLLLLIGTALSLITVFSAIGICERTRLQPGGLYFLISHVLGAKIGGATALIYTFGQAVATGLVAVGFGESMQHFFGTDSKFVVKLIAILTLMALTVVNAAGVSWVVRLQLVLLACIAMATLDFFAGSLWTVDTDHGVGHISFDRLRANSEPFYNAVNCSDIGIEKTLPQQSFFTVFGVLFANFLGILAGVNMSGDLRDPQKSIPLGELSAVGLSSLICSVVDRQWLLCDHLISERVSLTGWMFMGGLYICSLSSTIGSLLGTPRVLQGIAAEGLVPALAPLAQGIGANKNPVLATIVLTAIACLFVLIGDLNQLAILSTMPFLITYAMVNYAYVSLAMSFDLVSVTEASTIPSYGSTQQIAERADLDELFPERKQFSATGIETTADIVSQPASWYSHFSNRYVSLVGCMVNLLILIFINFWYAIVHFAALILLYFYIAQVTPACFPGISQFSIVHMFRTAFSSIESIGVNAHKPCVIGSGPTPSEFSTQQLNEHSSDYEQRKQYHHAKEVTSEFD